MINQRSVVQNANLRQAGRALDGGMFFLLVFALFFAPPMGRAQSDPNAIKNQANNNIQVASKLMDQAASLLSGTPTRYALKTAMDLYVQAGQLAEQSARMYEALGPQYATSEDVENSNMLVQRCLETIQKIRSSIDGKRPF